jgi:hypothetical protein
VESLTPVGIGERLRRLKIGTTAMAIAAWATVISGTWIVYPWYREALAGEDLSGCEGAQVPGDACSPRDFLLSNASGQTEDWHKFGMEWKEHIAWISPMLATLAEPHRAAARARRLHRRVRGRGDCRPLRCPNYEGGADHVSTDR